MSRSLATQRNTTSGILALLALAAPCTLQAGGENDGFNSPLEGRLQAVAANGPQRAIGEMVEEICPNGIKRGVILSQDLQDRCTNIVQAALVTGDEAGAQSAMQALAAEEVNAIATTEVDASSGQMDIISARLQGLRGGGPRIALALPGLDSVVSASGGAGFVNGGGASADAMSRLGVFVSGEYTYNDRDQTSNEAGFESDGYGVTFGVDYQVSAPLLVGAAFTYDNADADIALRGGTLETDSYGGFAYATYQVGGGWYVDVLGGYTQNEHEQVRNVAFSVLAVPGRVAVDQAALSELDSDEIAGSVQIGFDAMHGAWTVNPYLGFDAADVGIDGYTERMSNGAAAGSGVALQVDDQSFTSLTAALGARIGYWKSFGWGTWYPQVMAEYVHEFDNEGDPITGRYVDAPTFSFTMGIDDPDQDYAQLGVTSNFVFDGGASAYVSFQSLVAYRDLTTHAVEIGVRVPF